MKPIHLRCPACRQRIGVDRLPALGELLNCRGCGHRFHFQLKGGTEPESEFNVASLPDGADRANPPIGAERVQPSAREAPESFFERLEREPGAPRFEPADPRSMPPARPPRPAIGAVDTPPATLSHTSTIGLLLASTAIAFAITAVALIGVGVGALGIGRQTASNREETAPPSEGVGKIEKKNPPAAAPEEKGVDQKPSNSQPPPPVAPPAPPAPGAPAAVPVPPASPAKPDPSQAVALIAIFNPKSGNYDIMTVGWAVDERHFVTLGIPYAGREQRQFVAFVGKHRIILSHAAYHPRLREAIALRNREDVLKEGQAYDLAVFRTPMPIIPGRLELTPVKNADLRDAARLLGFAERAGEIGLDQAIPFRDYQVGPLPTEPDRVIVTQDIADGPTLLGGPVLDSHGRVIGMVQPSVENGAAKVVSARVIHELIETLPKSGP